MSMLDSDVVKCGVIVRKALCGWEIEKSGLGPRSSSGVNDLNNRTEYFTDVDYTDIQETFDVLVHMMRAHRGGSEIKPRSFLRSQRKPWPK